MPMKTLHTHCTMDCPDTCALEVDVQDGKIEKIRGGNSHPNTDGFICTKVARFDRRVYHEDRILHPMRRTGGKGSGTFERISWDSALDEISSRFKQIMARHGGEAILPYHYGGSNGILGEEFLDDYLFAKMGASRLAKTICAVPSTAAATGMYGKMPGVAFEDYVHARFICIWGANPKASNIHLIPYLKEAKKRGAFIVVIDPRCNFSADEFDLHIPVFPGTDLPLALSLVNEWSQQNLFDRKFLSSHAKNLDPVLKAALDWPVERAAGECGVSAESIRRLAHEYAERSPTVMRCGWGPERSRNGGQAIAAILALPALLGKFGIRGGGYTLSNSGAFRLNRDNIFGSFEWNTRIVNMTQLGKALSNDLTPPIQALFVYNCNPVVTAPDQNAILRGLGREDLFTVVHEQVMTDTARWADIVLPAPTFLEQQEIKRAYGSYVIAKVQPVIEARGEARPNEEVFASLGRAMGFNDPPFQWDTATYMEKVGRNIQLHGRPVDTDGLESGKTYPYDFPGPSPIQFKTAFPLTADRKIDLCPAVLGNEPFAYLPLAAAKYPLALISPASSKMITSTMGEYNYPELSVTIHPDDARQRGISSGSTVRVFNELGEVICKATVSDRVRPGVLSMPKGAWMKASGNARGSTALCPATISSVGGGACFNDARVEISSVRRTSVSESA